MKAVINPRYNNLRENLCTVADGNITPQKVFCNRRNTVELVTVNCMRLVVKRYKKPNLVSRLIYTLFRPTKARKAFENATKLLDAGFNTAAPVAFFEKKKHGIFSEGIFISEYLPLPQVADLMCDKQLNEDDRYWLCRNLSLFTLELHEKGFVPGDYNASNIMYERDGKFSYRFSLIDINRMTTGSVPHLKKAMRAFFQLGTYGWNYGRMLQPYADARGFDLDDCIYHLIKARRKWNSRRDFKQFLRHMFSHR